MGGLLAAHSSTTLIHLYAAAPTGEVVAQDRVGRDQGRLFRHSHEQSAGHFAVCTDERRIVGVVVLAKKSRRPGIGLFLRQRFVGRAIVVKLCIDFGFSVFRQGRLGSNEVRTIIGKDSRCEVGFRR